MALTPNYLDPDDDDDFMPTPALPLQDLKFNSAGNLTIEFGSQQAMIDAVAASMLRQSVGDKPAQVFMAEAALAARKEIESVARKVAREIAPNVIRAIMAAAVESEVKLLIEQGFVETDSWGSPKKAVSFRQRVSTYLFGNDNDRYNGAKGVVDTVVKASIDELLKGETAELIKAAKQRLAESLDKTVLDKISELVRDAIGFKAK